MILKQERYPNCRTYGLAGLCCLLFAPLNLQSMDEVTIVRSGVQATIKGEIVVEALDGGMMMRAVDGRIWMIQPGEVQSKKSDKTPFQGLDANTLSKQVMANLPRTAGRFRVLKPKGYAIIYNTSPLFANWVKSVYLRLNVAFKNFWENKGVTLDRPDVPLCVIIFKSKKEFDDYSIATLGATQGNALAYYNMQTNQVVMYDLTGVGQFGGRRISSSQQLQQILRQPAAEAMVATIVHEAVHQISFNSGLQKRFGPYPFWLNEGLAMFFEVPDLKSKRGWQGIGKMNYPRLNQIKKMIRGESTEFFSDLLKADLRFQSTDPDTILNSYAESWALNFFLIHRKPKQYVAYLKEINQLIPLEEVDEDQRLQMFEKHFGSVDQLKTECFKFILN